MTNIELLNDLFSKPVSLSSGAILSPGLKTEFLSAFSEGLKRKFLEEGKNPEYYDWDKYIEEVWEPKLFDGYYLKPTR